MICFGLHQAAKLSYFDSFMTIYEIIIIVECMF